MFFIEIVFWGSVILLVSTFAGYPLVIYMLARFCRKITKKESEHPEITIIIIVRNESSRIHQRLANLLESNYPSQKLRIVVTSDGSTDPTSEIIREFAHPAVHLLELDKQSGKAACINAAVADSSGEILVFADARQRFASGAICELIANFADPRVGAVSGALEIEKALTATGRGVDAYWRLEKFIRSSESRFDSCIGCTGAIYALRRNIFRPIPNDTILDDVVIPMQAALAGYRVIFDPAAIAYDRQPLDPERERHRKERTIAGNYQMLFRYPSWLLPWCNRLWWQLICHKYLRLAGPFLLVAIFSSNMLLLASPIYRTALAAQLMCYFAAVGGLLMGVNAPRICALCSGFVFLNFTSLLGLWRYVCGFSRTGW